MIADANEREWALRHVRILLGMEAATAAGGADERAEAVAAWA